MSIFTSYKLTKEDYLDTINGILSSTKPIVDQVIELTDLFKEKHLDEANYLNHMSQVEPAIEGLYLQAIHIGSAPTECNDLSQRFQSVMATAHNTVLPFSEKGLETWEEVIEII